MNQGTFGLEQLFFLLYFTVSVFAGVVVLLSIWRIGVAMRDISETLRRMESKGSAPTSEGDR